MYATNKKLKKEIVEIGKALLAKNLIAGTWGNISVRTAKNNIIITPSGGRYDTMTVDDLVEIDLSEEVVSGKRQPSSELACHMAIYNHYPQINAVIHTHSLYASACAAARKGIPPVIEDMVQIVGADVPVAKYALPGSEQLANNVVIAMQDRTAVLMANHGAITCGTTLAEALLTAEILEKSAQIYVIANSLGGAVSLPQADIQVMREFYLTKYRVRQQKGEE